MSEPIICTHRWISPEVVDPGYCQCQRWYNHEGPHRCCCGDEADDE